MWERGQRHGQGIWSDATGENKYTGEWKHDQKHGWGIMQYPSGGTFEGEWAYDKKNGFGTMYWTCHMERYRGYWADNAPHGVGEHTYFGGLRPTPRAPASVMRCNRYLGMMHAGKRHGEGCMLFGSGVTISPWCAVVTCSAACAPNEVFLSVAVGARYEGEWQNGAKHGSGVYIFEDNSCWIGQWDSDRPVKESNEQPFAAMGTCPQTYVEDLLRIEPDTSMARKCMSWGTFIQHWRHHIKSTRKSYVSQVPTFYDLCSLTFEIIVFPLATPMALLFISP